MGNKKSKFLALLLPGFVTQGLQQLFEIPIVMELNKSRALRYNVLFILFQPKVFCC
jgi:hypothetical protein